MSKYLKPRTLYLAALGLAAMVTVDMVRRVRRQDFDMPESVSDTVGAVTQRVSATAGAVSVTGRQRWSTPYGPATLTPKMSISRSRLSYLSKSVQKLTPSAVASGGDLNKLVEERRPTWLKQRARI